MTNHVWKFWPLLLAPIMLAGCNTIGAGGTVKPQLPNLPQSATEACSKPRAAVGDDLGVLAARWKTTAVCESGKRRSIITFYGNLQRGLAGK